eukprot:m.343352 g.343352  ORF g.343352 m.343352 type:complete len:824 (-) comp19851_c1_seq2:2665-5136(-)
MMALRSSLVPRAWSLCAVFFGMLLLVPTAATKEDKLTNSTSDFPWLDPDRSVDERASLLVAAMNTTEVISQMVKWAPAIPRLRLPPFSYHTEAAHGVVSPNVTSAFPVSLARAASWNLPLERKIARAIGMEGRAVVNDFKAATGHDPAYNQDGFSITFYAPNINLVRDIRWGRAQETRGESPHLSARFGSAFVSGVQAEGEAKYLLASGMLKHFAVYNLEGNTPVGGTDKGYRRMYVANVSRADFLQTFIPAFEESIAQANPRTVMCSYNGVNGYPMCASPLLRSELRGRLGFDHVIFSDGGAVTFLSRCTAAPGQKPYNSWPCHNYTNDCPTAAAVAVNASVDLNSGGFMWKQNPKTGYAYEWLPQALERGLVSEALLAVSTKRIMKLRIELGLLDVDPKTVLPWSAINGSVIDSKEHRELARQSAAEGLVLLRNEGQLLPLSPSLQGRIAVIGPNADRAETMLGNYAGCYTAAQGSRRVLGNCTLVTPLQGLVNAVGNASIRYTQGCDISTSDKHGFAAAIEAARWSSATVMVMGLIGDAATSTFRGQKQEGEAFDRVNITLPGVQLDLIKEVIAVQPNTVVVLMSGGPVSQPWLAEHAPALVQAFYPGEEGGTALADAVLGKTPFSGRMPLTVVQHKGQLPPYLDQNMSAPPGRTHRYFEQEPLFAFGYGMSTGGMFEYSAAHISVLSSARPYNGTDFRVFNVSVTVTNTGHASAPEVVMVYAALSDVNDAGPAATAAPRMQLVGFTKVTALNPGASVRVAILIGARSLALVDAMGGHRLFAGEYKLHVGGRRPGSPGVFVNTTAAGCPKLPLAISANVP